MTVIDQLKINHHLNRFVAQNIKMNIQLEYNQYRRSDNFYRNYRVKSLAKGFIMESL